MSIVTRQHNEEHLKRIFITGNAGSGKTTLAKDVAWRLNLPFYSLDTIVWQEGWKKTPAETKVEKMDALIGENTWVIDGVASKVLEAADVVILLDIPRYVCLFRAIKQNWLYLFRSRPEMPPNCPEWKIIPKLCKIIWNFPKKVQPQILTKLHESPCEQRFFHIRSKSEMLEFQRWLDSEFDLRSSCKNG